jgi:hypothetical protein
MKNPAFDPNNEDDMNVLATGLSGFLTTPHFFREQSIARIWKECDYLQSQGRYEEADKLWTENEYLLARKQVFHE